MIDESQAWRCLLNAADGVVAAPVFRDGHQQLQLSDHTTGDGVALFERFLPCLEPAPKERCLVLAHLGQSLDGCIALDSGESKWITGKPDLLHTHQLRALCDAVLVGAQTVIHDDPQLTVRHCEGENPIRVVFDPNGRVGREHVVFTSSAAQTLWVTTKARENLPPHVKNLVLQAKDGVVCPKQLCRALKERGIQRLFVEGGGVTISRFLIAHCVDRLHLVVAPLFIGGGRSAFPLPLADALSECPRPNVSVFSLGKDVLFDCWW